MGYEYVGISGNEYEFNIILTLYINCGAGSNVPNFTTLNRTVGIYSHDLQNNPIGGANKNWLKNLTVTLTDTAVISPPLPPGCSVGASTCIKKGVFQGTVTLPLNFTGFHAFYERCCRNNSITNLIPQESMSFYTYISPPLLGNSSPVFTDDPVPFLCVGDSTSILNSAYDPDGDALVFSFVEPYDADQSSNTNPAPNPPQPTINWPINNVTYAGGYSLAQVFGAGGYSSINATTGLTKYLSPATGDYVVAVEIKEYRNGNLIGITRRDLQLLVLNCPVNPAPNIDPAAGTTLNQFSMEAGETYCFDFGFNDPNNNNLTLTASGLIFDSNWVNPPATIIAPVSGPDTVSTQFCWTTSCSQAQTLPYQFQVSVIDDGCPPKTTNVVYQITVNEVAPPDSIVGPDVICQHYTATYSTQSIANTTYDWSVSNGTIVQNYGDSVDVNWSGIGTGTITLNAVNQYGCKSPTIDKNVTITPAPFVDAGIDTTICKGDTIQLSGSTTANPGYTSSWTPLGNITNNTTLNPSVYPQDTTYYLLTIDIGGGCLGMDSLKVSVNNPQVDAGNDTTICAGSSIQLNANTNSSNILWTPQNSSLSDSSIANPIATPNSTTNYIINIADNIGCSNIDSIEVSVDLNVNLSVSNDTSICANSCANLIASGATSYAWAHSSSLTDTSISNPQACPLSDEVFTVYGYNGVCIDSSQVNVFVLASPNANAGNDVDICFGDSIQLSASGGNTYLWTPNDSLSNNSINNPIAWPSDTTQYIVLVTDTTTCFNYDTVNVNVRPLPNPNLSNDINICIGDSTQLNASNGITYLWTPNDSLSNNSISNPFVWPSDTTTYTVSIVDAFSCSNTDSITINVNRLPIGSAGNDTTICFGDTIQLSANGGASYLWNPNDSLSNDTVSNPLAWPSISTQYIVNITDTAACVNNDTILITVNPIPNANAGNDIDICYGDSIQLSASGGINYLWSPNDSLSNNTINNPLAWPSDTTQYIVLVTDASNCSNSDTLNINVNNLPIADAGLDVWVCPGDSAQLSASGGISYIWSPITGLSNPNISNPNVSLTDTLIYLVSVTSSNGCIDSDSITVFANQTVPSDAGNDTTICSGDSIQIGGNPTSVTGTTYLWSPSTSINDDTLANPVVFPTVSTMYYVITSNDTCTGLDSIFVDVLSSPNINAGVDIQICLGDSATLSASGGASYLWTPTLNIFGDTIISNDTIANPIVYPVDTTNFIVIGTDANSCNNSDTITVIVNPLPNAFAGIDINMCIGDTANLSASGGLSYLWTPNDSLSNNTINNPLAWPIDSTLYFVQVTDSNSCISNDSININVSALPNVNAGIDDTICLGETVQLIGTGAIYYQWSPNDSISNNSVAYPFVWPSATTTYILDGTDALSCSNIDSVTIVVNSLPSINAGSDIEICLGDSASLSASGGISYQWSPNIFISNSVISNPLAYPIDTSNYIVSGFDANNCSSSDTITIIVNPLPNANAGFNVNICEGDNTLLNASGGQSYLWTPSNYVNHDTIASPLAYPDTSMQFIVQVTDSNSCIATDTMLVIVFMIYTVDDTTICNGDSARLNVFGEPAVNFLWTPNTNISNPNIINPWVYPNSTTTYTITATDSQGCIDQDDVVVEISDLQALFTSNLDGGCDGAIVTFTNTSDPSLDFIWYFSDASTSTDEIVEHTFDFNENFDAYLEVTNSLGCIDTSFFSGNTLSFEDYFDINIPNVFTPNGDGENDLFSVEVPGKIYECVDMKIYNRWGQVIFISTGNNLKWDGRTNVGIPAPEGTYFYTIDIKEKSYNGSLSLFR